MNRRGLRYVVAGVPLLAVWLGAWLALCTERDLRELPMSLVFTATAGGGIDAVAGADADRRGVQVLDRGGEALKANFTTGWNLHDVVSLHEIPPFLRTAFVAAED